MTVELTDDIRRATWRAQYEHRRNALGLDTTDDQITQMVEARVADDGQRALDHTTWRTLLDTARFRAGRPDTAEPEAGPRDAREMAQPDPRPPAEPVDGFRATAPWPDPTPEMLADPLFEAIWQAIKTWDINVPGAYGGYMGATGNHARAVFDAIQPRTRALAQETAIAAVLKAADAAKELAAELSSAGKDFNAGYANGALDAERATLRLIQDLRAADFGPIDTGRKDARAEPENPSGIIDMHREADRREVEKAAAVLTRYCHGLSRQCGWWDRPDANDPMMTPVRLMLTVSELGEAMEGHRKGRMDDHLPHRKMIECELGDAVIRIFDQAGGEGYDLPGAIAEKLAYNQQRADHRPENRAKPGGKAY